MINQSRSAKEIKKHVSDGVNKHPVDNKCDLKPKPAKTKEAKNFSKSEAEMVDAPAHDFNHREGDSQEPYILAERDRYTEHEQSHGTAHHKEHLNVNSLQQTLLMMMRRTIEQITDVSRGNTAAVVGIEQFL